MKARILPLDTDEHRVVQSLLPWYVNGTLDGTELSRVEAHLAQCARCQADTASQHRLRALPGDAEAAGGVERDWTALCSRLDAKPAAARRPPLAARWRWPRWQQLALGVQGAMVLVLALAWFSATRQAEPYRALAAPSAAAANALVVFRSDATEAQIRHALRACEARFVGGPTVTDAYLLRVPGLDSEALARLRAQPAVLRVESLDGEGPR